MKIIKSENITKHRQYKSRRILQLMVESADHRFSSATAERRVRAHVFFQCDSTAVVAVVCKILLSSPGPRCRLSDHHQWPNLLGKPYKRMQDNGPLRPTTQLLLSQFFTPMHDTKRVLFDMALP